MRRQLLDRWNPRYVAYAKALGFTDPAACAAAERVRWPGGCNAGFIVWIGQQWAMWCTARHRRLNAPRFQADQEDFDTWLGV